MAETREQVGQRWREKEQRRLGVLEQAFEEYESGELSYRKLRNICLLVSSAPPSDEAMEWAKERAQELGLMSDG